LKTLLVAGAGRGLGRSVAKRFAREGYGVALAARNEERLARLADEIAASPFPADLTDETAVGTLFREVEARLGPVEAVAFVAATRAQGPFAEMAVADFEHVWRQSCLTGFLVGREAARCMVPRKRGTVISPAPRAARAGGRISPPSPPRRAACVSWRRAWRESSAPRASTSPRY
jgi:NAD(P)-dependent dehydrogenase (short-subunit alcohol dehydrogenase family)